jgi:hypothetical protein
MVVFPKRYLVVWAKPPGRLFLAVSKEARLVLSVVVSRGNELRMIFSPNDLGNYLIPSGSGSGSVRVGIPEVE